jgi:hypothetical protein
VKYSGDKADLYAWYYHTQACFQFGGSPWTKWNRWFQDEITRAQAADGSWPPMTAKGPGNLQTGNGGSAAVYRTALCTLMLETFYRILPMGGYVPINGVQPPATPLRLTLPPMIQRNVPGAR